MKIKHLNLLLTYKCPSRCRHCCYFCGLEGSGLMSASDVKRYLNAFKNHSLESLWIYGGEPFLYPGVLTEVVRIARAKGIPEIGVLTNGYWAKRIQPARKNLSLLQAAGLNAMIISTDGFHAERISPQLAIKAAHLALEVGMKEVGFSVTFIPPRGSSNPFNDRSEEIWAQLRRKVRLPIREDVVTMVGRAAEELIDYCQLRRLKGVHRCHPPRYIGGTWDQPEGLEIDPHGWVMICPGLSLGQVGRYSLSTLIQRYENNGSPLWQAMRQGGVANLLEMARERGYEQHSHYVDRCHLCYEVRKFLRPYFPLYLAPDGCYLELSRDNRRDT